MNREERRELTKRKWLSRAKKVYNSCGNFFIPAKGIKDSNCSFRNFKVCESITDFLDNSVYAKMLKNCTVPYRSKMMQFEYKKENRKKRKEAKKQIEEGVLEYGEDCLQKLEDEYHAYVESLWTQTHHDYYL